MQRLLTLMALGLSVVLYQNCSGKHDMGVGANGQSSINTQLSIIAFENTLHNALKETDSCARCHGVAQQPLHSLPEADSAHEIILSFDLVDLQDPANSRLVTKLRNGHQGFDSTKGAELEAAIQAWADALVASGGSLGGNSDLLQPTFSSIFTNILEPKCVSCHSNGGTQENINYESYVNTVNTGRVVPFDAAASRMFTSCQDGSMPQGGQQLPPEELAAIQTWINEGALNN